MQWVVESYALLLASLVLVGGALGDRLGRKRVFLTGVVLFALASAACGAAPNATLLIAARGVQGVGASLLVPGSLALISASHPDEQRRGRAIGTWSATSAITAALGPVLGGWVVAHGSWRWLFLFNLPLSIVVATAARRVAETRDEAAPARIDVAGASLVVAGLGAIVFALLEAPSSGGLGTPRFLGLLVAGIAALIAFVLVEARVQHPMVPLALFRERTFAGTNLLTFLLYASLGGVLFFLPFNLVQVQGYSPTVAGASILPLVLLVSVMSPWTGALAARIGPRVPLVAGPLLAAGGFALLAVPSVGGSYWSTFFPGVAVLGLGMGTTVAPLTTAVMSAGGTRHAGVASGINNAVARAAGLLAVAALGVVIAKRFDRVLDGELAAMSLSSSVRLAIDAERAKLAGAELGAFDPATQAALRDAIDRAYVAGFRTLMLSCAALAVVGALLAGALVEGRSRGEPQPDPE
jgi:EmrB/QacA subfamily drug resistance transporter